MSEACSDMLGRLSQMDQSREEFVSNVSHELKTPLTSMKVLSESLLGQENVPNEIYRDFMKDIAGEIDRENSIINDLLSLVKLDRTASVLNIQNVDINAMVKENLEKTMAINNVSAVVFDWRGFDTLGESFILLTAIAGSFVILGVHRKKTKEGEKK